MQDLKDLTKIIRHLEITAKRNVKDVLIGNYKSSFRGQGLEVDDLRIYEEGDDIRHIDWITTAKQGVPHIRKYKETRELTIFLIIDVSSSMNFSACEKKKKDIALELAATILFSAHRSNDKFGAVIFSDVVHEFIPVGSSKAHLLRILRSIILNYENNKYKGSSLSKVLSFFNTTVKKRSICFLISDHIPFDSSKILGATNRRFDFVFLNIFDEFERGKFINGVYEIEDPETGERDLIDLSDKVLQDNFKKIIEKKNLKEQKILKQNKIDSLEVRTIDNIFKELNKFFKKRIVK